MSATPSKTIVAALDTTDTRKTVFKEALVLASSTRASVTLVAVTPHYEGNMNRICIKNGEEQFSKPFVAILDEARTYATSLGLELETIHRTGTPAEEILSVVLEKRANLLLLGCARKTQVERMLFGRTMMDIVQRSPCDVLLLPEDSEVGFGKILVGINDKAGSRGASARALELHKSYGSEVHALYASNIPPDKSLRYGVQQEAEKKARAILSDFRKAAEAEQVPVITTSCLDTPAHGLISYARDKNIQLLLLGTKPRQGVFDGLLDSVVESVASKAPCPVLVSKPQSGNDFSSIEAIF